MKILLLVASISIGLSSYCQESKNRLNIEVFYQPNITIKYDKHENEKPNYGYKVGIGIGYKLNEKASLNSGISYANKGFSVNISDSPLYPDAIPDPLFPNKIIDINNYYFLSIPLVFKYYIIEVNKLKIGASAGIYNELYLSGKTKTELFFEDNTTSTSNSIGLSRKFNMSAVIGLNFNYSLSNNLSFVVEPNYDATLFNYNKSQSWKLKFWDLGLKVGMSFNL